jgi:Lrp/AsnC family transcriptional regulator, leucine-responsive regulatory protein
MIDGVSLKILKILQEKARIPNVEVARQVGMAPSAVLERIRKLERQGYIDGYEVRLNPGRFGKTLVAFITVVTEVTATAESIAEELAALDEVQEVHFISGEDAFLVKLRVADPRELGRVIRENIGSIEGVQSTQSRIVMDTYKETARIPIHTVKPKDI